MEGKMITGNIIQALHQHPFGPCLTPDETATCLQKAMDEFDINTVKRAGYFLGQTCLESNEFSQLLEDPPGPGLAPGSQYEGRLDLGNTQPGDGAKFPGRGYIQLTGRANCTRAGQALGLDLANHPELLQVPDNAARAAGWFWKSRGLNELADQRKFLQITKTINGGYNDLKLRDFYTTTCLGMLGDKEKA